MAMTDAGMKAKIKAAYNSRTGLTMTEGDFQVIIDLCKGIIEEIITNSLVTGTVTVPSGPSAGTFPINPDGKVSA